MWIIHSFLKAVNGFFIYEQSRKSENIPRIILVNPITIPVSLQTGIKASRKYFQILPEFSLSNQTVFFKSSSTFAIRSGSISGR